MGKRKQITAPAAPPKAEGKDKKRTPQSAFDPAAGKDLYEPEKIIAQRMAKGDLNKKTKAETLEASLFAAFDIDWCAAHRAAHPSHALLPLPV